jgi:hypothetical protein
VEVVRESQQPLPNTHVDNFDTKTYLMPESERAARAAGEAPAIPAPPPPPQAEAVLRRKGGWSGAAAYQSIGTSHEAPARPRPVSAAARAPRAAASAREKPEQYAATKPGFVSGRAVWSGTAEKRAAAAIAAARGATNPPSVS